jgi:protein MpaA
LIAGLVAAALAVAGLPGATGADGQAERARPLQRLERTVQPGGPVRRRAAVTVATSSEGRPIRAITRPGVPTDWAPPGGDPLVLVFGCIHGDECAGIRAAKRSLELGCPPPGEGLVVVPNLNPDGLALGTRLNGRGVDLNRNFGFDWRQGGVPGDLEYPGPRPLSEPETRIARQLIRTLRPDVTIWFHQQVEPLVRAWGRSVPAARTYARLARLPFVRLPWVNGTAPNWQNHAFPETSSFVVELPADRPVDVDANARAIFSLAGALMRREDN